MQGGTNSNRAEKRITSGARVSGSHGQLRQNPNPAIRRRVKERLYGTVVSATESNKYIVKFDNGLEKECTSRSLKLERSTTALPVSEVVDEMSAASTAAAESGLLADGK